MFLDLIALVLLGGCYLKEIEMPRASSRGGAVAGPPSGAQDDGSLQNGTSHMSLEELLELQSQVGTKAYKQLVAGGSTKKKNCRPPVQKACVADKHRPLEMSAKVRVPFLHQVVPISKKVARDPCFDDLSGEYNPEVFDKTYQFLDDIRAREKELVKKQLKKRRSGEEHEKLQHLLQRMEQQEMKAAAGTAPGPEAGAAGSGPAGPSAILPE